jgi:D-amino-acid oxidase
MDRRRFLSAFALTTGCSMRRNTIQPPAAFSAGPRLMPVNVSSERIIRTIAGLRPYRPSGFVVRTESIEGKTIVHNYGHGGGGVTLSWGTAHLAVEQALPTNARRIAVLGAGAVGLATARLLQENGVEVTIYAKTLPPGTTSNIAGAQVFPVSVFARDSATPAFLKQFVEAARFSYRRYQLMVGDYYGIRWLPNYQMDHEPFPESGLVSKRSLIVDMMPELRDLRKNEHPFPFPYVRQFDTMFIQPAVYLEAMLREFRIAGGTVVVREMHNLREVLDLPHPVVVNCTGLGSKTLCNDSELTPIKGQLTFLLPQPEVQYATLPPDGLYMFPRRDGILLGGTHEMGNWDLEPNREAEARIVATHAQIFRGMRV